MYYYRISNIFVLLSDWSNLPQVLMLSYVRYPTHARKILCFVILHGQQKEKHNSGIIKNLKKGFWNEVILANILSPFFSCINSFIISSKCSVIFASTQSKNRKRFLKKKLKIQKYFPATSLAIKCIRAETLHPREPLMNIHDAANPQSWLTRQSRPL